ncbi:unnamed protein product [Rhizoctonia solani]|uniref:F-box domain-containing protein n=1 Tax=Rhizoctonia solani TaxID=456999 RepID=A0A8H3D281_9AGAM|nr:unnamed protein product [Rhizoctonia solani]CAE7120740.1 unnamed protein product [Rhizoctonia solani]
METTVSDTLQRWNDARYTLDQAIQTYLDHTITLQPDLYSGSFASMHNTTTQTWLDRMTNPANDLRFVQAQAYHNQIRNSFLPINTLPLEILLRIVHFSAFHTLYTRYNTAVPNRFDQDKLKNLIVLTHVCTHWRKVMLGTQTFWSHFEFNTKENPERVDERARAYLERAPDAPLSFYIHEHWERVLKSTHDYHILEHLGAQVGRLARLTLMQFQNPAVAKDIVMFWMKNGTPGTLRTLIIHVVGDHEDSEIINTRELSVTRERADLLLAPIRVLYLNRLRFDWDSPVYHNLVVLRISRLNLELSPYIHEILAVLSACPQLHTLQFSTISIRPSDAGYEPVYLSNLEHFSLIDVSPESFSLLLPAIFPQSQNLAVRLNLPETDTLSGSKKRAVFDSLCLFLARTNTTRLFIQELFTIGAVSGAYTYDFSSLLTAVPNLHTLIVHFEHLYGTLIPDLIRLDESKGISTPICPRLHTLYIIHASVSIGVIQQIVEAHHIRKLRFLDCTFDPSNDKLHSWLTPRVEDTKFYAELSNAESVDWYHLMD